MTDPGRADDALQAQAARLRGIIEEARAESVSDDYAVRVAVGPGDTVLDVEVTSRARGYTGDELGALIVAELKKASRELAGELNEKIADILGAERATEAAEGLGGSLPSLDEIRRQREELQRVRLDEQREQDW